jgi:hypothetical protein
MSSVGENREEYEKKKGRGKCARKRTYGIVEIKNLQG